MSLQYNSYLVLLNAPVPVSSIFDLPSQVEVFHLLVPLFSQFPHLLTFIQVPVSSVGRVSCLYLSALHLLAKSRYCSAVKFTRMSDRSRHAWLHVVPNSSSKWLCLHFLIFSHYICGRNCRRVLLLCPNRRL